MAQTVLIVDDEEGMRRILAIILERAGYDVLVAANGQDALAVIDSQRPGVIVLDHMMPGLTGADLCKRLKADPELRQIPVIMHTASIDMQNPRFVEQVGADRVLIKPCPAPVMMDAVAGFFSRQAIQQ